MDERAYYRLELDVEVEDQEKALRVARAINAVLNENEVKGASEVKVSRVTSWGPFDVGDEG